MIQLPLAIEKVTKAKCLVKQVECQLPPGTSLPEARRQFFADDDPADNDRIPMQLKLALTALCLYLDKHFKHGKEAKLLTLEPMASHQDQMEME